MGRKKRHAKLHIGSGDQALSGWVNIDLDPYPAVDRIVDVTKELPFEESPFIFAEHFLEHLSLSQGVAFLSACRRALSEDGVLRLTTPNLDWVAATHYKPENWKDEKDAMEDCLTLNRAFYGWGHRFLYNREMLTATLQHCGFREIEWCLRSESRYEELTNLERHEVYTDMPELPHILILEARGRSDSGRPLSAAALADYRRDTEMPFHLLQYAALSGVRLIRRLLGRATD